MIRPMHALRRFALATVMLLVLAAPLAADDAITIDFLPSRDLPSMRNQSGRYQAIGGMCNGIDELANVYYRSRRDFPGLPPLHDITARIGQSRGEAYLKQVLETAHFMSNRRGFPAARLGHAAHDPAGFADEVAGRLRANRQPVSLGLGGPGGLHRVSVYGAEKVDGRWVFKIADSNYVGVAPDAVTLAYDARGRRWVSAVAGRPADVWTLGDVIRSPIDRPVEYNQLISLANQGKPIAQIRDAVHADPVPSPVARPAIMLHAAPQVSGVLIRFDPAVLASLPDAEQARLDAAMRRFLADPRPGTTVLGPGPRTEHLALVPLRGIRPERDLGGLTRLVGFVQRPDGSLLLVGQREAGVAPIPASFLAVALQSVYAHGETPFVSLDPAPQDLSGPQHVRIGDLAAGLRQTDFVRTLLEADYLMKRINLGKADPGVAGFARWCDLMERAGTAGMARMWLMPAADAPGASYRLDGAGGRAVLFDARVQVKSEQEKMAEGGVLRAEVDAASAEAADQFSTRYDALAARHPAFRRLRQLFDAAMLAASWRALDTRSADLKPWLAAVPARAKVPVAYPGIGPELSRSRRFVVSGGAQVEPVFRPGGALRTSALAPLLEARGAAATVVLPAELSLSGADADAAADPSRLDEAALALRQGDAAEALAESGEVLARAPGDATARLLHAMAQARLGRWREAAADLEGAELTPATLATRAMLRATAGEAAAALADAREALRRAPDDEQVLALCVLARIAALDLDGAAAALSRLARLVPAHPMIASLDAQIVLLRGLGPERARDWLQLTTRVPAPVANAVLGARGAGPEAVPALLEVLRDVEAGTYDLPAPLYVPERLRVLIAIHAFRGDSTRDAETFRVATAGVDRVIAEHADWATGYYCKALLLVAQDAPTDAFVEAVRAVASHRSAADPLLPGIELLMGVRNVAPLLPVLVLLDRPATEARPQLLDLAVELSSPGPGRDFLARMAHPPAELTAGLDPILLRTDPGTQWVVLDRLTAGVDRIPPDDPAYVFAMGTCLQPLRLVAKDDRKFFRQLAKSDVAYEHLLDRMLALARPDRAPRALAFSADLRYAAWAQAALGIAGRCWSPDYPGFHRMKAVAPRLDRISSPASRGDPAAAVRAALAAGADAMEYFVQRVHDDNAKRIAAIRARHGDAAADRVAFLVALMHAAQGHNPSSGFQAMARLHPGIRGTSEYRRAQAVVRRIAAARFGESLETLWRRVLGGLRTRLDGESLVSGLQSLRPLCKGREAFIDRCIAQARLQIQLGVVESGT